VIPTTLLGVVVFAASVGPGYLYVALAERYRPPRERSALKEAAELVVVGSIATALGLAVALVAADETDLLDTRKLAADAGSYIVTNPARSSAALLIVLIVSYGSAALVSYLIHKGQKRVYPDSAWWGAFERDLPEAHGIYATAELADGRAVTGAVRNFTAESVEVSDRELTLHAPADGQLLVRTGTEHQPLLDTYIILRGDQIKYVSARYLPLVEGSTPVDPPKKKRFKRRAS
jgi:hypothetical protein